ncbi:hypothetical protein U27_06774 [Candidatus Vecturithrix granuli]|uniref:Putative restriction endonuclease domain-containing protein n=1 Tax=Vecturithrix granuli TaxID=1499967 RepID=A0A081C5D4_VECG1|nr:hypothetical protein U27_06774 [Candidatus Vecturithrix granuli]
MYPQPKTYVTPEEYLAIERQAEYKSEYWNGEMFAMAGASERHVLITTNTAGELRTQLKSRPCRVYSIDLRVKVRSTGLYTYPDIVVICEKPVFDDKQQDTLLNPIVLIEVLSPSTEAYDRGEKFSHYRTIESLSDYLLISQTRPRIEHFIRQPHEQWIFSDCHDMDGAIAIASIGCTLALAEVYDKVEFEKEEERFTFRSVT